MKKPIPFLLLLTLLILLTGCSLSKNNTSETINVPPPTQDIFILGGKIQAGNSTNVASKINAKIAQIQVDVGTKVNEGDPIIYLETNDIQSRFNQAEAAVATAQANLDKIAAGSRPEQIFSAQAALEGAQKSYELTQTSYDRQKYLFAEGVVSKQDLEKVEGQLAAAKAQCEASQYQLDMLKNGATEQDIEAAAAAVKQAEAAVKTEKTNLNYGIITAPISGTVTAKNINKGEMSGVGQPLITIVGSTTLYIDSYAPEEILPRLKVGQKVNIKICEFPDKTFQGEISIIDAQVDSRNKKTLVKISINDKSESIKPGMFAEIGLKNEAGE